MPFGFKGRPEKMFTQIVRDDENWKENNATRLGFKKRKFKDVFTAKEQEYVLERLLDIDEVLDGGM